MKPVDPFYWSKLRAKSLAKNPLKRSPIKKSAVRIKPVSKTPKIKSLGELIKQAVTVFHKWIRERDSENGVFTCISCGIEKTVDQMHAGHYLPAGNNGVIRLHEFNVNGQCITCNIELHGHQDNYRIGLIAKIGLENVEALEVMAKVPFKWNRDELAGIIERYRV